MSRDFKSIMILFIVGLLIILTGGLFEQYTIGESALFLIIPLVLIGHILIFRNRLQNPSEDTKVNKGIYVLLSLVVAGIAGFGSFMALIFVFFALYPPEPEM